MPNRHLRHDDRVTSERVAAERVSTKVVTISPVRFLAPIRVVEDAKTTFSRALRGGYVVMCVVGRSKTGAERWSFQDGMLTMAKGDCELQQGTSL